MLGSTYDYFVRALQCVRGNVYDTSTKSNSNPAEVRPVLIVGDYDLGPLPGESLSVGSENFTCIRNNVDSFEYLADLPLKMNVDNAVQSSSPDFLNYADTRTGWDTKGDARY